MKLKDNRYLYGLLILFISLSVCSIMFAAAYFLTRFVYQQVQWAPSAVIQQVINSLLGMISAFIVLGLIGRILHFQRRSPEMDIITPILNALEAIARGNFDVQATPNLRVGQVELFGPLFSPLTTGINSMAQRLKEVEAMRQEFISDVSHEIQSPLTSIRGFAQALRDEQLSNETRTHYLDVIENESLRLSKLSANLLTLATLNSPHMQLAPKAYRLDKQIRRLVLSCEPQWAAKSLDVELTLAELSITADEELLSRVWLNLLHNSIKFTPNGGRILLALKQGEQQIEFCIQDTGIGIAPEDQARLFERFFKADRARSQAMGGSGLGLAIVKKIVEMHAGTIQVISQCDMGTTFTITLPNPL